MFLHCMPQEPCRVPAFSDLPTSTPPEEESSRSSPGRTSSSQTQVQQTDQSLQSPSLAPDVWENADQKIYTTIRYSTLHRFRHLTVHLPRSQDGRIIRCSLTRRTAQIAHTLVRFEAERLGDWPQVPEPLFPNTYELRRHITLHAPQANATRGVLAYRATGDREALAGAEHHRENYRQVVKLFGPGAPYGDRTRILRTPSVVASWQLPRRSVGVVFIDAAHDFASVWGDLVAWTPLVAPGGILAGHDFQHRRFRGVTEAVQRAQTLLGWRVETLPGKVWYTLDASCGGCGAKQGASGEKSGPK